MNNLKIQKQFDTFFELVNINKVFLIFFKLLSFFLSILS